MTDGSAMPNGSGPDRPRSTPAGAPVCLIVTDAEGVQTDFQLKPGERYAVGRHRGNDIVLPDPSLSRRHAEIWEEGGRWMIADCGSSNGTHMDGRPLAGPADLGPGVFITLGPYTLKIGPPLPRKRITFSDRPISSDGTFILSSEDAALSLLRSSDTPMEESIHPELDAIRLRYGVIEKAHLQLLAHEPMDSLLPKILGLVAEAIQVDRTALLRKGEDGELEISAFLGGDPGGFVLSRSIARRVMEERVSILTADAQQDDRFARQDSILGQGIRSVMAVPLSSGEGPEVMGILYADSRLSSRVFDNADLRILTMLGNIAAIQIRNAILFEDQVEKRRLEKEADAAAAIQRRLLPSSFPEIPGYAFSASSAPCTEVGGDYFDCLPVQEGRVAVALGDVAGKGMGAALLMAALKATFHARIDQGEGIEGLVGHLGRTIERDAPSNRFVTFFMAVLDPASHRAACLNAGHAPAPVILRAGGEITVLESSGPPLGIVPDYGYRLTEVTLEPGDLLFACTDGVTELENINGEMFGDEALRRFLASCRERSPEKIRRGLTTALERFSEGAERGDDLTMLALKREAVPV